MHFDHYNQFKLAKPQTKERSLILTIKSQKEENRVNFANMFY